MIKQKNTVLSLFPGSLLAVLLTGVAAHALAGEICITTESDPDGDGFGWEQESSCLVTEASATVPTVFHPRTNEQLNVQRITWVEADFADRSFSGCDGYLVDPDHEQDSCLSCGSEENTDYQHFADGNGRLVYSFGESSLEAEFTGVWISMESISDPCPLPGLQRSLQMASGNGSQGNRVNPAFMSSVMVRFHQQCFRRQLKRQFHLSRIPVQSQSPGDNLNLRTWHTPNRVCQPLYFK